MERGIIDKGKKLKVLGRGEIATGITITADKFSKSAREKIEKAGGKAVEG
jgi:large subunit ribosomal protein L15